MRVKRWLCRAAACSAVLVALASAAAGSAAQADPTTAQQTLIATPAITITPSGGLPAQAAPAAAAASTWAGLGPSDLTTAYRLPTSLNPDSTVAVIAANGYQNAASDLAAYRGNYSLPACTTASGCLKEVNETGGSNLPTTQDSAWSITTAESLDAISAVCPDCHLLVVEASSAALSDLLAANDEAVTLGAKFISDPWFIPEAQIGANETADDFHFNHPGVAIIVPDGNGGTGFGVSYPAASPYVVSVGSTTLIKDT